MYSKESGGRRSTVKVERQKDQERRYLI